jgi:hypothetical protein
MCVLEEIKCKKALCLRGQVQLDQNDKYFKHHKS